MPNFIRVGDIFFFEDYYFNDTQKKSKHFGLAILPPIIFQSNAHFCVVTSKKPYHNFYLLISPKDYKCLSLDTYVRFDSIDLERFDDVETCKYKGTLNKSDIKKGLKLIYKCISLNQDCYMDNAFRGAVLREWKKRNNNP